jgi:hypothetical protein
MHISTEGLSHSPFFLQGPPTATQISQLPSALLTMVLQHVPLQQRLSHCSLVCEAWAAAATAASTHFVHEIPEDRLPSLLPWLDQHGTQLLSLDLSCKGLDAYGNGPLLQLPVGRLTKLQQLSLSGFDLLLSPSSSAKARTAVDHSSSSSSSGSGEDDDGDEDSTSSSSSSSNGGGISSSVKGCGDSRLGSSGLGQCLLPDLQSLCLHRCRLPSPDSLAHLAASTTGLTCLVITSLDWFTPGSRWTRFSTQEVKATIADVLCQHQQLSVLQLPSIVLGHAGAQAVCKLGSLRELSVYLSTGMSARQLQDLPSSITKLTVDNSRNYLDPYDDFGGDDVPSDESERDRDAW